MQLYDWVAQAKRDAVAGGQNNIPAVCHKRNHCNILVTLELDDFMTIYREFEAGRSVDKKRPREEVRGEEC